MLLDIERSDTIKNYSNFVVEVSNDVTTLAPRAQRTIIERK